MKVESMPGWLWLGFIVFLCLSGADVLASESASEGGMPWESPLIAIQTSLTGPVAGVIALIGIAVAGGMLIFGGELSEFARRMIMLVLVLGMLVAASSLLTALFSDRGGLI